MTAARAHRFTVEGDPSDVIALARAQGWKITTPRWWQRTTSVNVWVWRGLWALYALTALHAVFLIVRSLGG